jgi:hypothetical protein
MKLFGTESFKLARKQDPITSKEAGNKVNTTRLEEIVYNSIKTFGDNGCISDEVLAKNDTIRYS